MTNDDLTTLIQKATAEAKAQMDAEHELLLARQAEEMAARQKALRERAERFLAHTLQDQIINAAKTFSRYVSVYVGDESPLAHALADRLTEAGYKAEVETISGMGRTGAGRNDPDEYRVKLFLPR